MTFRGDAEVIKITIDGTTISATPQNIGDCVGGDVIIEKLTVVTDSTGIVGSPAGVFIVSVTSDKGSDVILNELYPNLGPSQTVNLDTTGNIGIEQILTQGKNITYNSNGAPTAGSGSLDVYITYRQLSSNARVDVV